MSVPKITLLQKEAGQTPRLLFCRSNDAVLDKEVIDALDIFLGVQWLAAKNAARRPDRNTVAPKPQH